MKLAELFALSTGSTLSRPNLYCLYYPVPFEKYVTISTAAGTQAKQYSYFNDVVELLMPVFKKNNITFLQIGDRNSPQIYNCVDLRGGTLLNHSKYLIKNALCHIGNDTCLAHFAGAYETPCVILYGATTVSNHSPYWFNPQKSIFLQSDRKGLKPSYAAQELNKMVDLILPETVAQNVLKVMSLGYCPITRKSIYFGENYLTPYLEIVPDEVCGNEFLPNFLLNVRMDYLHHEENLQKQMSVRPCSLILSKPIVSFDLEPYILNQRLKTLVCDIQTCDDDMFRFVETMSQTSLPLMLISDVDGDALSELKLKYMDIGIVHAKPKKSKKDLGDKEKEVNRKTLFKTQKYLLSNGKIYLSNAHRLVGEHIASKEKRIHRILDNDEFFKELDYFYLFSE